MSTIVHITKTDIDIEKLKLQIETDFMVGSYSVLEITPGSRVVMSGTLSSPEQIQVQTIVTDHVSHKDSTQLKVTADLYVDQDIDVEGTNTIFNTNTVTIEDNIITLSKNNTNPPAAIASGIEIFRGGAPAHPNAKFVFDETLDAWKYTNGDDVHYYKIFSYEDPNSGLVPRNKIEEGTENRILFNADTTGIISENTNFKWFVNTQGSSPNEWKGLGIGSDHDIHLEDDCRICRGDVSNHFIRFTTAGLQICDDTIIEFWKGNPSTVTNKKFTIGADNRSYVNFIITGDNPLLELRINSTGYGDIRSYFYSGDHIRHHIYFGVSGNQNALQIESVYGELNLKSETGFNVYNNNILKFQTTAGGFNTSYTSLIVQPNVPSSSNPPKIIMWPNDPDNDNCEIKSYYENQVDKTRHSIYFNADDSLVINSHYGALNLKSATGFNIYNNNILKFQTTAGGFNTSYDSLILQTNSPRIYLKPDPATDNCEIKSYFTDAPSGQETRHSIYFNADDSLVINSHYGDIELTSHDQIKFATYTVFNNHVHFNQNVDFLSYINVGSIKGISDHETPGPLTIYNNDSANWIFNTESSANYFRPIYSAFNQLHPSARLGSSSYMVRSVYAYHIKGCCTVADADKALYFHDNDDNDAHASWIMKTEGPDPLTQYAYFRPNTPSARPGRIGSANYPLDQLFTQNLDLRNLTVDANPHWQLQVGNPDNPTDPYLLFILNGNIKAYVDASGFHNGSPYPP